MAKDKCTLAYMRLARAPGGVIMMNSQRAAQRIAAQLKRDGWKTARCGHFVASDADAKTKLQASKLK